MKIKIKGTGSAVPKLRVTNDDLSKLMDTSDEWIRSRTGIGARHLAVEETTTGLAVAAAKEALKDAEMTAEELDLIIAATVTADKFLPNLSCEVQSALGAKNAVAFDLNAACSGFLFALNTVQMYLENGVYKKALVIGAETLSKIMDWNDRSTCVLFGDGAGAAVVEVDSETNCKAKQPGAANKSGILSMVQGSDGARGEVLRCDNRPVNNPFAVNDTKLSYVSMKWRILICSYFIRQICALLSLLQKDCISRWKSFLPIWKSAAIFLRRVYRFYLIISINMV